MLRENPNQSLENNYEWDAVCVMIASILGVLIVLGCAVSLLVDLHSFLMAF